MAEGTKVRVTRVTREAPGINTYELVPVDGTPLERWEPGAHVDVTLPDGTVRQYSLCNDAAETHRYLIAVQREERGRGGSRTLHDMVRAGDALTVSAPRNAFALQPASSYVLIAGGIGVTPLLAMAHTLAASGADFTLHYCTRDAQGTAFRELLSRAPYARHVRFHHDGGDPDRFLDVKALLARAPANARLYTCGPAGLMESVREAARAGGWPDSHVHFESFGAGPHTADTAFEVVVKSTGQVLPVPAGKSLLNVLLDAGVGIGYSCQGGSCGACQTNVLEGEPEHRDQVLPEEEKRASRCMYPCVSRAKSERLVLDL